MWAVEPQVKDIHLKNERHTLLGIFIPTIYIYVNLHAGIFLN